MHFDWKAIARMSAAVVSASTGQPAIMAAEGAAESAIGASQAHKSAAEQADAYAALAVQVIETAEGFDGKELVDDATVQALVQAVHDALTALAAGLAAKKAAAPLAGATAPTA